MIIRVLKIILITCGCLFLLLLGLSFTPLPFYSWYYLSTSQGDLRRPPDYIVVMGSAGIPSDATLMRTWYAAQLANRYPRAKVIVSLPGKLSDTLSSINRMKNELMIRGVAKNRILMENQGINTRDEALCVYRMLLNPQQQRLCIVSSPEHMYRSVKAFKKAGFMLVDGMPAFDQALESSVEYQGRDLGGYRWIPSLGGSISIRYTFWGQMKYELIVFREATAIAYYKLKGWI